MDYIFSLGSEISRREFPSKIKTLLNFLFVASITSTVFKKVYYDYSILDITDYPVIYAFIIEGHFFIPCVIFYLVWISTYHMGVILFTLPNMLIQRIVQKKLVKFSFTKLALFNDADENVKRMIDKFMQVPDDKVLQELMREVNTSIKQEDLKQLQSGIQEGRNNIEKEFVLLIRASIAMTIYFLTLPYFGSLMFFILILLSILFVALLTIANQFVQILPTVLGLIQNVGSLESEKQNPPSR